jgi:large subunit ribosomal protein L29
MKATELRTKSDQELAELETQLRDELFRLRMKHFTGQLQQVSELKERKRAVARIKTIINERAQA